MTVVWQFVWNTAKKPLNPVHHYCVRPALNCDVKPKSGNRIHSPFYKPPEVALKELLISRVRIDGKGTKQAFLFPFELSIAKQHVLYSLHGTMERNFTDKY